MKKRFFVVLTAMVLPLIAEAKVLSLASNNNVYTNILSVALQRDTVVKDLEDLEAMMPDTVLQPDTVVVSLPAPKGYNGLKFVLDRRHRYVGDKFIYRGLLGHTYLDFGGGVTNYLQNGSFRYTPFANLHLGLGKDLSPMSSLRLSVEGSWGFTKGEGTISSLTTFKSLGVNVDYLFNFTNYMLGYRPERPLTVSGVMGLGLQSAKLSATELSSVTNYAQTSGFSYGARFGLQFKYATSPHAFLALEPFVKVGSRKQDLVPGSKFDRMDFGYGANLSYIWYFWPELSKQKDAGDFMKRFEEGERFFYETYAKKHWRRPMFFDYSIGPVFYNHTALPMGKSIGYTANAYFGWWLSSAIGLRTGLHISNADWTNNSSVVGSRLPSKSLLGTRGAVLDFLFNPFGFKRNYDWDSKVGMNLIAGYEFGRIKVVNPAHNDYVKGNYVGYRLGSQLWMKLTNDLRLNIEPTYSFLEFYKGTSERKQFDELALKLGLTVLFRDNFSREKFNLDSIEVKDRYAQQQGFFLGLGMGWNTTVHTWRYANGNNPLLKNGVLFGGYNLNEYHGIRLSGEYLSDQVAVPATFGGGVQNETLRNTVLSLDYQLNLLNAVAGYNPYRRWGTYIYGGPALALGSGGTAFALNFGGMLTYQVNRDLALFYSHTVYRMPKDRYVFSQVYRKEGTFVNSLNVGLLYNFNRPAFGENGALVADYSHQPLMFEYSVGPVWYNNVENSMGSSLGYTANANIGWWLNSFVGARAGVHISNADWAHDAFMPRKNQLGFFAGTLDLMLNPMGITRIYNWNQPAGFNLFIGAGLGKVRFVTDSKSAYESKFRELRLGAQFWLKLTDDLRLNLEPTYSMLGGFTGAKVVDKADELAMKVGVSMLLRDKSNDKKENEVAEDYRPNGFFFGAGLGWNTTVHTWRPTGQGFQLLKNGLFFGGYKVNEYHGLRLSGEYLADKVWNDLGGGNMVAQKFNNTLLSLDYQFDIFNALAGIRPGRRWDASLYIGPSLALGKEGTQLAWNFGGILSYQLSRSLALFYSHTVYRMSKERYKTAQVYRTPGTIVNSLNVGVMYNLNRPAFGKEGLLVTDYTRQPLFLEYSIGPAWFNKLDLSMGSSLGYTANANIGWWLNSAIGVRGGVHISNADWTHDATGAPRKNQLGFLAGTLDLMFNPLGMTHIYDWNQPVGFNLFAGAGMGKIRFVTAKDKAYEGRFREFRMGAQFWVKLCNDLRLNIEPTYSMLGGFSGAKVVDKTDELAMKVGVSMLLRDKSNDKKDDAAEVESPNGFFLGAGLGWNTTVHTWRPTGQGFQLLKNGLFFGGYKVNEYHAVRLSGEYLTDKVWDSYGRGDMTAQKFDNTLLSLDYQFNIFNAFAGIRPGRRWGASLYTGPTLALGKAGTQFAWNFGGILTYNVSRNLALFYSHTIYRLSKERYNTPQVYRTPGTIVNSLNVGVMYNLNRPAFGKEGLLVTDYTRQPLFLEYSIGPAWFNKLDLSMGSSLGYTANANIGWWLNSAIGVRGGVHISNADWTHDATGAPRKNQLGFLAGTLDLMFNPLGMTHIYDWNQPVGFNLFAGAGMGKIRFVTAKDKAYEGRFREFRMGAQFWVKLCNDLRLNIEPTYSMLGGFSGAKVVDKTDELAMKVGVSMLLRDKSNDKKDDAAEVESPNGFFLGAGLGWNTTVHTWRPTGQGFQLLKNGLFFGGYKVNEYHAVRLSGEYLTDKVWDSYGRGDMTAQKFDNTLLSLDYQFNIFNAFAGIRPGRRWGASLYTGPTLALGKAGTQFAWNFGGILTYNVSRNLALFYSHTIYRLSKERYNTPQVYRTPGTIVNSLNLGVMYNINKAAFGKEGALVADYAHQPVFFEYSVGTAMFNKVDLSMAGTTGYNANANLGWWLNSALGFRGGVQISNADWSYDAVEQRTNQLGYFAGTLDLMFNPLGFKRIYNWNAPAGFNLFLGGGLGKIRFVTGREQAYESKFRELRLGTQFWLRLAQGLRLNFEPTYSIMGGFEDDNRPVARTNELALKLGMSVMLNDKAADKKGEQYTGEHYASTGFFLGAGAGWNTAVHTWRTAGQSSSPIKNGLFFAGFKFDDYSAVRASGEYLTDKVTTKYGATAIDQKFNNTLVSLGYQFDILNALGGINPSRRWDVGLYTGPSLALGDKGTEFAWHFGGTFSYHISRTLSLFYNHMVYRMSKERYQSLQIYRTPGTFVNSLNFGLMLSIGSRSKTNNASRR